MWSCYVWSVVTCGNCGNCVSLQASRGIAGIMTRIGKLAFVLAICLQFAFTEMHKEFRLQCARTTSDVDEENAKDCADSVDHQFADQVPTILKSSAIKNLTITYPPPCKACYIRGVENLNLYKRTTSHRVDCGDGIGCVDQTLFINIPRLDADCYCAMDTDPANVVVQMQDVLKKPNFGMKCNAPVEVASHLGTPDVKFICGDPEKFANMTECSPLPKMPSLGKRLTTKETGWVHAKWSDVKLAVSLRACSGEEHMTFFRAELENPKPDEMTCECDGKLSFMAPCKCMVKANFLNALLFQGIQFIFPCYFVEAVSAYSREINVIQCKDYWL